MDKRKIFFSKGDWEHFQRLLFTCNSTKPIKKASRVQRNALDTLARGETLVDIYAYVLMDNHFHLLLKQKAEGGITKFMHKLLTAFSKYMNIKYNRTGPLMCRPFRAKHVDNDSYFRWLLAYIHLNPIGKIEPEWETDGLANVDQAQKFLCEYTYSSYIDYFIQDRPATAIIMKDTLPVDIATVEDVSEILADVQRNALDIW